MIKQVIDYVYSYKKKVKMFYYRIEKEVPDYEDDISAKEKTEI